jgi:hypothetical protein
VAPASNGALERSYEPAAYQAVRLCDGMLDDERRWELLRLSCSALH